MTGYLLAGSKDVVKSLTFLIVITEQIKKGTAEINASAALINKNMVHTSAISTTTNEHIEDITLDTNTIASEMTSLFRVTRENEININTLDEELNQFKTE